MTRKLSNIVWLTGSFAVCCVLLFVWLGNRATREPRFDPVEVKLETVEASVVQFYRDMHFIPRRLTDLVASNGIEDWGGPYARNEEISGPWGKPVGYEVLDTNAPKFRLSIDAPDSRYSMSIVYEP
jgi:hypothetical protein